MFTYLAQLNNPLTPSLNPATGDAGVSKFSSLLATILSTMLVGASILFMFYFIMGAISWITSGGDKGKLEEARSSVTNAVVGLVVTFSVFAVISLIDLLFGTSILQIDASKLKIK
jgi:hypothetical protein